MRVAVGKCRNACAIASGRCLRSPPLTRVEELVRTIHAHPTLHEAIHEAAEAVHGAAIHI